MKKSLGIFASLFFLCATALLWTGCSDNRCCDMQPECQPCKPVFVKPCPPCEPICAPICEPKCEPKCAPECPPVCEPKCAPVERCEASCTTPVRYISHTSPCKHPNSNKLECLDGITVTARNPKMCMLGEQYPLEFDIHACDDVCEVIVTTHLPDGVTFIRSVPEAEVNGSKLTWYVGPMQKGECITPKVWLRCECEGELCACFCASAKPVRFCSLLCAKPILSCEKCGPKEVCPGDRVEYTITVMNRGSCAAEEVILRDELPDGVEHQSGQRTLVYKLGTLEPCQTKTVNICTTAVKRGRLCNNAVVTACNADSTSCQWCTDVCQTCIEITKTGTKEVTIGKNADYVITILNPGDKVLHDVVVTDNAPSSTSIVNAIGATVNGNQAIWKLRELKPGEKKTFNISLTTCIPGCFTDRANVTTCEGCNACTEFTTRWKGRPALNVCMCDTNDPLCKGENTDYCISILNQGSEADTNVKIAVRFPDEITPMDASGDCQGTVSGQTVTFAPIKSLAPRQTVKVRVGARANKSGNALITAEVSSDNIKTPIKTQESTTVN